MIKAIVFDFDGVIIDTEKARYDAWQAVFSLYDKVLPVDEWVKNIGRASYAADPFVILEYLTGLKLSRDTLEAQARTFELEFASNLQPLPGVVKLLKDASSMNIPCAVASSSTRHWVDGHLKRMALDRLFKTLVCREDTKTHKPLPEPYLTAAHRLQCEPQFGIAIEDAPLGIQSATTAGLRCVGVGCSLTRHLDLSNATWQFDSLDQFNLKQII